MLHHYYFLIGIVRSSIFRAGSHQSLDPHPGVYIQDLVFCEDITMASLTWRIYLFCAMVFALALSQCPPPAEARIDTLSIKEDSRDLIVLEQFVYTLSGQLEIELSNVELRKGDVDLHPNFRTLLGFFIATEDDWVQVTHEIEQKSIACPLESRSLHTLFKFNEFDDNTHRFFHTYPAPGANRYTLMFANCQQGLSVSMTVRTSMYNVDSGGIKDYLSEGQTQLPMLFFCFFWIYVVLEGIWIYVCIKQKQTAHRIHILMGVLVLLKALYMLSEAEDKYYIKTTGTAHGWDIAFYAFSFLKGVMLFTVIVLIGTGWSFLKPHLQGREKKVLMIVIPLQVLADIATVVIGETGLSSRDWLTWTQLLLLVDVICCCAVLFPIVWSIKHLREAAQTDGKAARNLMKLTLFRQYYIVVVTYIYFTRIVVFALTTVTPYTHLWVNDLVREFVTLVFFVFTGYKFRPVPHNPYFVLDEEEEEAAAEAALKDDDFEL